MTHDEIREAPSRARTREVPAVPRVPRAVRLHSRPHIDLLRVAGALCRS
ncbi:putative leader peptide [Streptomyces brasiliscabiei]